MKGVAVAAVFLVMAISLTAAGNPFEDFNKSLEALTPDMYPAGYHEISSEGMNDSQMIGNHSEAWASAGNLSLNVTGSW